MRTSPSSPEHAPSEPHPWLEEKVYARLRQRTGELVKQSVDQLRLDNQEARAYYEQHRSWRGSPRKRAQPLAAAQTAEPLSVKPGRDEQRVRQRYRRMSKDVLVERLITAERTAAEQRERWVSQQDEAFTWRLRAEMAERRLQEMTEKNSKRKQL